LLKCSANLTYAIFLEAPEMQGMKVISNLVMFIALLLSNQIFAENIVNGDPSEGEKIASKVCAGCHSADGNSIIPSNPILAGQHPEYITKQLLNFKPQDNKPAERKSPVMAAMVAPLSAEDMKNIGAYYAQQEPTPGAAKDKELAEQGEKIYRGGNIESGLPACSGCHSPNGSGIPPHYPRLAGQHAEYTVAQLRYFRTGQRANDKNSVMRGIVARMSEQEMAAVAEFISGLN
jgi:cytochrome c553